MKCWSVLLLLLLYAQAQAGAGWDQRLGASLPLDLTFVDETGRTTQLGEYFGSVPVVIVFGYFHCARLCPEVFAGVREGLRDAGVSPNRDYRLLAVSIDPTDTPVSAKEHATPFSTQAGMHLLTSQTGSEAQLAHAAGFAYVPSSERTEFAHPAGFVIATPGGTISRYFFGVRYPAEEIRAALDVAREDRTGNFTERLLMICSSLAAPHAGQSAWILHTLRALVITTLGALAMLGWRAFANRTPK